MNSLEKSVYGVLNVKKNERSGIILPNLSKELVDSLLASDKRINEELLTYANNRKLIDPEDMMIKEIEENLGLKNINDKKDISEVKKEKGSIRKIISQVWNFEERNKDYLENYEQEKLKFSSKAQESIRIIEEESGNKIKVVVDKELTKNFRSIMGISYRGGSYLGQYIVVDDPKTLEDVDFLRHEAIHFGQQRDLGFGKAGKLGFIRWLAIGGTSLLLKRAQIWGLDEDMDYGTDNQITDFETYLNQFKKGYLQTRKPGDWKKYRNNKFRKQEMNNFKKEEIDLLKDNVKTLEEALKQTNTDIQKKEIELEIERLKSEIIQYEKVCKKLENIDEVLVVMIKSDIQGNKKENTREQVLFESKENRKIRLPIEKFIQKNGKKENNYKEGVELRLDGQKTIEEIIDDSKMDTKK